ncbi:hypothetical protein [Dolosicoccus paucivorans]|uniref:Cell envelope-related transcriptional attenuator domain-containing protein n=1 Tax=Dolosicoccus paucivorans TaxID=84521 RepID=A0A2N6SQB0_9LACT|nr:hypothetical protein [Dolosicoccus paucivorans]PMB84645.1 hypothetical protein CJ206_02545 [Dolosicoccus paucivorans]PMC59251.1 hypothetical protein CJ205_00670 [Dolosicoccus paucivorans]
MPNYRPYHYVETDSEPQKMGRGFFIILGLLVAVMVSFFIMYAFRQKVMTTYQTSIYQPLETQETELRKVHPLVVLATNYSNAGRTGQESLSYASVITFDNYHQPQIKEWAVDDVFYNEQTLNELYQNNQLYQGIDDQLNGSPFYTVQLSLFEIRPLIEAMGGLKLDDRQWSDLQVMEYMYETNEADEQIKRDQLIIHTLFEQLFAYKVIPQLPTLMEQSTYFIHTDVPYRVIEKTVIQMKLSQIKETVLSLFNRQTALMIH